MNRTRAQTSTVTFLKTELQTGLTFVSLAEEASDEGRIKRNRDNARKACQSARLFMSRTSLSKKESAGPNKMLAELEGRLQSLEKAA